MATLLADITPLRESPAFRRLWLGSAVAALGSQLTLVAVSLEVYRLTQDSLYVGLLSIFALGPLVVGGLLGGSIADAHDRRKVALLASCVLWLDHRLPGTAGLAAAGKCVAAVCPRRRSERRAGHQPAGPRRHHPPSGPQGAAARGQRPEHDQLRTDLHGRPAAGRGSGGVDRLRLDLHNRRRHLCLRRLGAAQAASHAAGGTRPAGGAAFRRRGLPLPWHAAQPAHDLHHRPGRHDLRPAEGPDAGHRRTHDRRRRGHRGRPAGLHRGRARSWPASSPGRSAPSAGRAPPSSGP